jgi:hypothetical protein
MRRLRPPRGVSSACCSRHRLLAVALTLLGGLALVPAAQAAGPPAHISINLSAPQIKADGSSQTIATATVTDASGTGVPGEMVVISSSDLGQMLNPAPPALATDNGDGTYTSTITSSTTPGPSTITAVDQSLPLGSATLTQYGQPALSVLPSSTVSTNEPLTLIAVVAGSPTGTVSFYNGFAPIASCQGVGVSSSSTVAVCVISFAASASPAYVTAAFVPASGSGGSNQTQRVDIVAGGTTTSLHASVPAAGVGTPVTYTASIAPSNQGPATPTGSVQFVHRGKPLAHCSKVPLQASGGVITASCTVKYSTLGTRRVTATYSGDQNFSGSSSAALQVPVLALGVITSAMQWTWGATTPTYTTIAAISANSISLGMKVVITCQGPRCPFARRVATLSGGGRCTPTGKHHCGPHSKAPIDLTGVFRGHRLIVGTQITIEILRAGWVGKVYLFMIRPGRHSQIRISCLAPGFSKPGIGC